MSASYYNENDPEAVASLRQLIADGVIASGEVDPRSIKDVTADDLRGFTQCHFFAGAGLWSVAARLAGWPDTRKLWTASCPCQPLSVAGRQLGADDPRHLWPDLHRVIRAARAAGYGPLVLVGEQVAGSAGYGWFDGVRADLAGEEIAARTIDIPACAIDAPHERNRLWWLAVANADRLGRRGGQSSEGYRGPKLDTSNGDVADSESLSGGREQPQRRSQGRAADGQPDAAGGAVGHPAIEGWEGFTFAERRGATSSGRPDAQRADGRNGGQGSLVIPNRQQLARQRMDELARQGATDADRTDGPVEAAFISRNGSWWADAEWITCHDGKARRAKPGIPMLVNGMAGRASVWRLAGNSIVPQLAAEVIAAFLDVEAAASVAVPA